LQCKSNNNGHRQLKMRVIEKIRQNIEQEIFDYTQLMFLLEDYRKPRDVISSLLQNQEIVRIRKGLYIFGPLWRRDQISILPGGRQVYQEKPETSHLHNFSTSRCNSSPQPPPSSLTIK